MERAGYFLFCFIIGFDAVFSEERGNLNCNIQDVSFSGNRLIVSYPGNQQLYRDNTKCEWKISHRSGSNIRLKFKFIELESNGGNRCYDYIKVKRIGPVCRLTAEEFEDSTIDLYFHSDGSNVYRGFEAEITVMNAHCDYGDWHTREVMTAFTFKVLESEWPFTRLDSPRGINFEGNGSLNNHVLGEVIVPSEVAGADFCYGTFLEPKSETPSCHASHLCQWMMTIPVVNSPFGNHSRRAYKFSSGYRAITTRNSSLQLEKVCLYVRYQSDKAEAVIKLFAEPDGMKVLLAENTVTPGDGDKEEKIVRIVADIPPLIHGLQVKLRMEITVHTGDLYLEFIKGCNPYRTGDRYEFKLQPTDLIGPLKTNYDEEVRPSSGKCRHGGLLFRDICLCPPGFTGLTCETGCGRNKVGPSCDSQCSEYSRQCKGTIICKSIVGCYCAPGWKGFNCETRCSDHEYGVGCRDGCGHCANKEPCDIYTGKCSKGCQPGFVPPLCQSKIVHLSKNMRVINESYNSADLGIAFDRVDVQGEGVPKYYQVQYREEFNQNWTSLNPGPFPGAPKIIVQTIDNLISGVVYEARIILLEDKLNSYQGDDLPTVNFVTKCTVNALNITAVEVNTNYIVLKFERISTEDTRCQYNRYEVNITGGIKWKSILVNEPMARFDDLLPATTYRVRVRQLGETTLPFFSASFTTLPDIAGTVDNLTVTSVDTRSVALKWEAWEATSERRFVITYKCLEILLYPHLKCSENAEPIITTSNGIIIEGLRPFARYSFQVQQSPGSDFSEIMATTNFFVDNPNIEIVNTLTNTTIDFRWKMDCQVCQLYSDRYMLTFTEDDNNTEPVLFPNIYTIGTTQSFSNLKPGTRYILSVYITKEKEILSNPVTAAVSTKPSVPTAVGDLTVYRVSRDGAGLRCSAPDHLYGNLESFQIVLDGSRNVQRPHQCQAWPQLYCFNLTGLTPNTTYNVSVSARNHVIQEFGDSNYVSFRTVESAPEAPTNLRVNNLRETSATVSWGPPNIFNGKLRSFLIKIDQTESITSSECCEYYPKVEVASQSEQPQYDTEINGLIPGSRYALSLMAETIWLGPPASLSFCTRPRAPQRVALPASTLFRFSPHSTATLEWAQVDPSLLLHEVSQPPHVHNLLILELSNDNENWLTTSDNDLDEVLKSSLGGSLVVIAEYKKDDEVTIVPNSGKSSVGDFGLELKSPDLKPGQSYRVAAASVARHCALHTLQAVWSLPFTVPVLEGIN